MEQEKNEPKIKNEDIALLLELDAIKAEALALEDRIRWEKGRMKSITQNLSSVPSGGGTARKMDSTMCKLEELIGEHQECLERYSKAAKKADRIIASIGNTRMKAFVKMLYVEKLSQRTVQEVLHLSRWAFESALRAVEQAEHMEDVKWFYR